jgi:ankyrin repeat protein
MKITPVHAAAANNNLTVLRALLEKGADVNAQQQGGFTALHEAARANNVAMARLCLEFGADKELAAENGEKPL